MYIVLSSLCAAFLHVYVYYVQKKNPVMKHIRNVPWELGDIVPDFVLGKTTCAMFLRSAVVLLVHYVLSE